MTNKEMIQRMSLEELTMFLDNLGSIEQQPWNNWGIQKFCSKCSPVKLRYEDGKRDFEAMPCEFGECPQGVGVNVNWCKLWLESEVEEW